MYFSIKNIYSEDNHAYALSIKDNLIFKYFFFLFTHRLAFEPMCAMKKVIELSLKCMFVVRHNCLWLTYSLRLTTDNTLLILIIDCSYTLTAFLNYFNANQLYFFVRNFNENLCKNSHIKKYIQTESDTNDLHELKKS